MHTKFALEGAGSPMLSFPSGREHGAIPSPSQGGAANLNNTIHITAAFITIFPIEMAIKDAYSFEQPSNGTSKAAVTCVAAVNKIKINRGTTFYLFFSRNWKAVLNS